VTTFLGEESSLLAGCFSGWGDSGTFSTGGYGLVTFLGALKHKQTSVRTMPEAKTVRNPTDRATFFEKSRCVSLSGPKAALSRSAFHLGAFFSMMRSR
jgi:hypothetical protein